MKKIVFAVALSLFFTGCTPFWVTGKNKEKVFEKTQFVTSGFLGEEKTLVGTTQFVLLDENGKILFLLKENDEILKKMLGKSVVISGKMEKPEGSIPFLTVAQAAEGWGNPPEKTKILLSENFLLSGMFGTKWLGEEKNGLWKVYDEKNELLFSMKLFPSVLTEKEIILQKQAFSFDIPEKNWKIVRALDENTTIFFLSPLDAKAPKNAFFVFSTNSDLGKSALYSFFNSLKTEEKRENIALSTEFLKTAEEKNVVEKNFSENEYTAFLNSFENFVPLFAQKNWNNSTVQLRSFGHKRWNFVDAIFSVEKPSVSEKKSFRIVFEATQSENGIWKFEEKTRFVLGQKSLWEKTEGEIPQNIFPSEFFLADISDKPLFSVPAEFLSFISSKYLFSFAFPKNLTVREIPQKNSFPFFEMVTKETEQKNFRLSIVEKSEPAVEKIETKEGNIVLIPRDKTTHFELKMLESSPENRENLQKISETITNISML